MHGMSVFSTYPVLDAVSSFEMGRFHVAWADSSKRRYICTPSARNETASGFLMMDVSVLRMFVPFRVGLHGMRPHCTVLQ